MGGQHLPKKELGMIVVGEKSLFAGSKVSDTN